MYYHKPKFCGIFIYVDCKLQITEFYLFYKEDSIMYIQAEMTKLGNNQIKDLSIRKVAFR